MRTYMVLLASAALAGCGGSSGGDSPDARPRPDGGENVTVAHYQPPAASGAGAAWGDVPYPSDLYLDGDGLLTLTSLPTGAGAQDAFINMFLEALHSLDGAGVWSFAVFPIDGSVDPDTLDGNVKLVRVSDLAEVPVDVVWREDMSAIVAVPELGTLLEENTQYAAYVTTAVKDADGVAIAPSPAFADELATPDAIAPLVDAIGATTAATLAVATVFHTESVTAESKAMRDVIAAAPPGNIQVVQTFTGATELDGLFGQANPDDAPGTLHPNTGYRGQPHGNVAIVMHGTVDIDRFVSDTPGVDGFASFDSSGVPAVKTTDTVKYTLVLPSGSSWANLPVVLYVPGINRTRVDMLTQADTATDRGMALIAIDMPYHGDRASSPSDTKNETTGAMVPDGIGDDRGLSPAVELFHLNNSGGIPSYHPQVMRENLRQAAMDVCSLVEMVVDGDLSAIQTAATSADGALPADLSFRGDVALLTESLGALVSGPCVAVEPRIGAVVYSSPASGFPYPSMMHSPNYSGLFLSAVTTPFGIVDRLVLGDPTRGARFEPMVMLYNSILERGEISGFAHAIASGSLRGDSPPHLSVNMAWADEWVSNDTTEHLAGVLGLDRLVTTAPTAPPGPPTRYVTLPTMTSQIQGNRESGTRTAALTVYHPSAHAAIRKLTDENRFEPSFPPFVELPSPVPLDPTPVVQMQLQWGTFLADYFAGTTPRVIDPYAN